jgi:hypothetical protein
MASSDRDVLPPNALSALRIPLAALLWLAPTEAAWTRSILGLAGTSDVLDGWVARRARARRIRRGDPGALASREARGAWIDGAASRAVRGRGRRGAGRAKQEVGEEAADFGGVEDVTG